VQLREIAQKARSAWIAKGSNITKSGPVARPLPKTRIAVVFLALLAAPLGCVAQNVLLAEDHGAMSVVVSAWRDRPCVLKDGKVKQISTKGYLLKEVPEYLPVFVNMTDVDAGYTAEDAGGAVINTNFHFSAKLQTSYPLDDVFIVLSMNTQLGGNVIFLSEVGHLDPNASRPLSLFIPLKSQLGSSTYFVHLFSGGAEVFQSQMPFWVRNAALNKMVARRIEGLDKAAPKFFIGPAPLYPKDLRQANLTGHAVVSIRIAANGEALDPVVKSASDPEFGQAALVAIQDWRFLPRVRDGHPVEAKVDVPFVFSPPKPASAGS